VAEESDLHHGLTKRPARVGVAGWSYPDWEGLVYPKTRGFDGLSYLATLFDTLEINSSFYRIPAARTTASWAKRVLPNPEFRFTLKLYKGFTHERTATADDGRTLASALAPLTDAGVLGALLLQFPWSFKNDPESRDYLSATLERFARHPLVVEVRHASWNQGDFYSFLAERGVGFCNVDQPLIGRSLAPSERTTGPVGYVRLHGRNYRDWFRKDAGRDARYDYLYSEEELDPWVEKISEVSGTASSTYVIANNHFRGQAVVNALQIRSRIENRKVTAPASLLDRYPVLARCAEPDSSPQPRLF
jgi:uncharacterized protein YecE (DUF72 family)